KSHAGMELRSDGQYVVAPGMTIAGRTWVVVNSRKPRILTQADLSRVLALFGLTDQTEFLRCQKQPSEGILDRSIHQSKPAKAKDTNEPHHSVDSRHLLNWYRRLAPDIGRNNALFKVA